MDYDADAETLPPMPAAPSADLPPPAAADPAAAAPAGDNPSHLLGLVDPELDDLKEVAKFTAAVARPQKRPKMTHSLFFEDDKGFKKILRTFPRLKFRGKGNEFEDLKLLIRNFDRWHKELYPYGKEFEDSVWDMRRLLQEKQKNDEGIDSDPHEQLHLLRFEYKTNPKLTEAPSPAKPGKELTDDQKKRIEENRARALALKQQKQAAAGGATASTGKPSQDLDMETLWRIEENKQKALALKRKREAEKAGSQMGPPEDEEDPFGYGFEMGPGGASALAPAAASAAAPAGYPDDEEDVFGFGGGLEDGPARAAPAPAQAKPVAKPAAPAAPAAPAGFPDDDEDVFGFGGGLDDAPMAAPAKAPAAAARAPAPPVASAAPGFPDDEDDVFGFGGGLDDPMPAAPAPAAAATARTQLDTATVPGTSQPTAQASAAAARPPAPVASAAPGYPDDEDDIFGFGGDLDEPPAAPAAATARTQLDTATLHQPTAQAAAPAAATARTQLDTATLHQPTAQFSPARMSSVLSPTAPELTPGLSATALEPTMSVPSATVAEQATGSTAPAPTAMDLDDDDVFGFGGGLDSSSARPATAPSATMPESTGTQLETPASGASAPSADKQDQPGIFDGPPDDDEDDPFGFNGV